MGGSDICWDSWLLGSWIGLESVLCLVEAHSPPLDVVNFQGAYVPLVSLSLRFLGLWVLSPCDTALTQTWKHIS